MIAHRTLLTPLVLARDLALAILAVALGLPLWVLPWRAAEAFGRGYGYLLGVCWPEGRRVARINLARAYGASLPRRAARRLAWESMASFGQAIAEGVQCIRRFRPGGSGWLDVYEPEDPDLERRILGDPRPKIFVTGHLGAWEVAGAIVGLRAGPDSAGIARGLDNVFLDRVLQRLRARHPSQVIEKRGAATSALERLRAGHSIGLLLDEDGGRRGTFVTFFGRPASTGRLPALLSLNTGAPIVVGACVRRPGRPYLFRLALLEPTGEPTAAAETALTQRIVATLEGWIRETPAQWRWNHWRWRTRPNGERETYRRRDLRACLDTSHDRGL